MADMVNHPPHYQSDNGVECIDAIRAALGRDGFVAYCKGNVIKYLWRDKTDRLEDMEKAAWYLERAIKEEESDGTESATCPVCKVDFAFHKATAAHIAKHGMCNVCWLKGVVK